MKNDVTKAAELVRELEATIGTIQVNIAELQSKFGKHYIEAEHGDAKAKAQLPSLKAELTELKDRLSDTETARAHAVQHYKSELERANLAERTTKWKKVGKLAIETNELAAEIEKDISELFLKYSSIIENCRLMYELAPFREGISLSGCHLSAEAVKKTFRYSMVKAGFEWASRSHFGAYSLPGFKNAIEESSRWITGCQDKDPESKNISIPAVAQERAPMNSSAGALDLFN